MFGIRQLCARKSARVLCISTPPTWRGGGGGSWSGGWRVPLWTDRSAVQICLVSEHYDFPPIGPLLGKKRPWYVHVCATGHMKDSVPLIEKRRKSYPGGRSPSFIYQVIIIAGLNKFSL